MQTNPQTDSYRTVNASGNTNENSELLLSPNNISSWGFYDISSIDFIVFFLTEFFVAQMKFQNISQSLQLEIKLAFDMLGT